MLQGIRQKPSATIYASYLGYITQAVINNFAPLLFVWFQSEFSFTLAQITLLTTVNFAVQLCVDLLSTFFVDRIGYRPCILTAHALSAIGLVGMGVFPSVFSSAYGGMMAAVVLYALGGGLIEVLISPIVEACPTERKEAAMSLLHSFYCWGHALLVLVSTAFFAVFGTQHWRVMACIWAVIPTVNMALFALVPLYPIVGEGVEKMPLGRLLRQKAFGC